MITEKQITVYDAVSPLRNPIALLQTCLSGIVRSRELIWILFTRDIKAQYRQSLMGYFWLVVPPVTTTAVWFFLNSAKIIRVETDIPYPLFVLIGSTVWTSFVAMIQKPLAGFNAGKNVFMKLNVPPEAFIFSAVLRAIFELGIRCILIVPVMIYFMSAPPWTAVLFPIALLVPMLMALAIGILLVPLGSLYSDVSSAISSFVGLFMYTAPVVYPAAEHGVLAQIMKFNPLTPAIEVCRDMLIYGTFDSVLPAAIYAGISLIAVLIGLVVLRVAMPHLVVRMGM